MNEEKRQCKMCGRFLPDDPEDAEFYGRFDLPLPDECSICTRERLLSFWVFGRFRKTTSALSGERIITTIPADVSFPIYDTAEWLSDAWDPMQYGARYDSSRPFLEQVAELQSRVPHPHQVGLNNVSCEWSDDVWESRNCYLSKSLFQCENISYGYRLIDCKDSFDITYSFGLEKCYDCAHCFNSYNVRYAFDARDCADSQFLYYCRNVRNSFMCWNLRNKEYHILNRPYTKEAYAEKLKEFATDSYRGVQKLRDEFLRRIAAEALHRQDFQTNTVNSFGNFLTDSKNCFDCYFSDECENSRHLFRGVGDKEVINSVGAGFIEKCAYLSGGAHLYNTAFALHCSQCRFSRYLEFCERCEYCFGSIGLHDKKYCVLNMQYTKEEYEKLTNAIIEDMKKRGEWGRFFPPAMAYCGYNFSQGGIFAPEKKEEILRRGWKWSEEEDRGKEGMPSSQLPDKIEDVNDAITAQPIICAMTGRKFNIAPHELAFYRAHKIPLPQGHFDARTVSRLRPLVFATAPQEDRCALCGNMITHFYASELGYKRIVCMSCYKEKVS